MLYAMLEQRKWVYYAAEAASALPNQEMHPRTPQLPQTHASLTFAAIHKPTYIYTCTLSDCSYGQEKEKEPE